MAKKKLTSAQKANNTRRARAEFAKFFGQDTVEAVKDVVRGVRYGRSSAAYKANLTRGTYFPYVYVEDDTYIGECNF